MKNNSVKELGFDMMGEYHKFGNSIIAAHNYGLSELVVGIKMISNDYDIICAQVINKNLLLVSHRIDGLGNEKK